MSFGKQLGDVPPGQVPPTTLPSALDRMLLIGDPQLTDAYSYDRPGIVLRISEFYSDLYMHRNYRHLNRQLNPQAQLFMGDLMDGGREWNDVGYQKQVTRFRRLFHSTKPQFFMAGNHDIGFGNGIKKNILERFENEFGPTSYTFNISEYSIVVLDTVSLSATNDDLPSKQSALDLLDRHLPPHPRILFTHVPLYRPPTASCGPDRQQYKKGIRQGRGYQYQNLVGERLSQQILERVNPVAVFSGDDHDYCVVNHRYNSQQFTETLEMTIPTFSMAQGLKYPGVVLLDLTPTKHQKADSTQQQEEGGGGEPGQDYFATKLCWLPDQIAIFIGYACLLVVSVSGLALMHLSRWLRLRKQRGFGKSYDEDATPTLPAPSVMAPRPSPIRRTLSMLAKDISDVASVGVLTYLACIMLL
ncbi:Metallo-dependent phosphatase-like protein [Zychaea mexicana]|uniref:Metallo-dependent phosphatase-like protein n=1 Tax=Zychaea mexicana TaxID=64656 RepID=UPI0022FDE620|nr:Metallo-dependent phosphatase-like protein [Zychaea mexicana]KAI9495609.1 Metallo-dependent phosphatase-like protein [Zychaea mexicana]